MVHKDFTSLYVQQHDIHIAIYHIVIFKGEIFHELANSNKGENFHDSPRVLSANMFIVNISRVKFSHIWQLIR